MIVLIEYNPPKGEIVTIRVFDEAERVAADNARLEIELDLHRRKIDHEVVLLEASSQAALRRTHRRYFEDVDEILRSASRLIK